MSDLTTLFVTLVTLLLVAGGAAMGLGATGPTDGTGDLAAQETTTQANETTTQTGGVEEPDRAQTNETTTQATETTQADGMGQGNQTAQAGNQTTTQAGGANTNVTARNVTIDTLVLRNVTVLDAQFQTLTVLNATDAGPNATNRTYRNASVQRIQTTGNVTDLTLTNVSFNSEALASSLVNETGRKRLNTRLVMDLAVLKNETVNGLVVKSATVSGSEAENVSVSVSGGANATAEGAQADDQPELIAGSAIVEELNVTDLEVSGVSTGDAQNETGDQTTEAATTTAAEAGQTTTAAAEQTTAAAGNATTEAPTTTPAEAGSESEVDGETTTTTA